MHWMALHRLLMLIISKCQFYWHLILYLDDNVNKMTMWDQDLFQQWTFCHHKDSTLGIFCQQYPVGAKTELDVDIIM